MADLVALFVCNAASVLAVKLVAPPGMEGKTMKSAFANMADIGNIDGVPARRVVSSFGSLKRRGKSTKMGEHRVARWVSTECQDG